MSSRERKDIVADIFRLIAQGRPKDGLKYFSEGCIQHNPYVRGGMAALFDAMVAAQKDMGRDYSDSELKVRQIIEDGDFVAVYTQLLAEKADPAKGGLRQVHVFRFGSEGKIVEYWDVTQAIQRDMPNPANAF